MFFFEKIDGKKVLKAKKSDRISFTLYSHSFSEKNNYMIYFMNLNALHVKKSFRHPENVHKLGANGLLCDKMLEPDMTF